MIKEKEASGVLTERAAELPLVWADAGRAHEAAHQLLSQQARDLAQRLQTRLVWEQPPHNCLVLRLDAYGLALGLSDMASQHMLRPDFSQLLQHCPVRFLHEQFPGFVDSACQADRVAFVIH